MLKKDLEKRLQFSLKTTKTAGDFLMDNKKQFQASCKNIGKGQAECSADKVSEKKIVSLINSFYLGEAILSEEKYKEEGFFEPEKNFWVIDPLDGTASYCDGYLGFCVQMAYIQDGKIMTAVVYNPAMNLIYWAITGKGAYIINKNKTKKLSVKSDSPFYVNNRPVDNEILKKFGFDKFLEMGSYGMKICKVAEGEAGLFLKEESFKIWDTAPGQLILSEAGGIMTLWDGKEIDYSGEKISYSNLVASSRKNHKKIISHLL